MAGARRRDPRPVRFARTRSARWRAEQARKRTAPRCSATLPRARNRRLLRLLVAYQIIWDFLDSVSERGASAGQANGRQLHLALIDALDPSRPLSDYYLHNPWREDGGYLNALGQRLP